VYWGFTKDAYVHVLDKLASGLKKREDGKEDKRR
jgi:hypothetical protein